MKNLLWAWRFHLQEAGRQAWLGLALICAAAVLAVVVLLPDIGEINRLQQEIAELRAKPVQRQAAPPPASPLTVFYRSLPRANHAGLEIARIFDIAEANDVVLQRAEYTWLRDRDTGLSRYQVELPLHGSYVDLRLFMIDLLNEMPAVAVNELAFRREDTGSAEVAATLRLTIYLAGQPT
jgi:hypothetical protein